MGTDGRRSTGPGESPGRAADAGGFETIGDDGRAPATSGEAVRIRRGLIRGSGVGESFRRFVRPGRAAPPGEVRGRGRQEGVGRAHDGPARHRPVGRVGGPRERPARGRRQGAAAGGRGHARAGRRGRRGSLGSRVRLRGRPPRRLIGRAAADRPAVHPALAPMPAVRLGRRDRRARPAKNEAEPDQRQRRERRTEPGACGGSWPRSQGMPSREVAGVGTDSSSRRAGGGVKGVGGVERVGSG